MKISSILVGVTLLGAASVAGAQVDLPNPQLPGSSIDTAVRLVATSEIMLDREIRRWLRSHYPGWEADPHELQNLGDERYAIVNITSPNNPRRRVYFRLQKNPNEGVETGAGFPL